MRSPSITGGGVVAVSLASLFGASSAFSSSSNHHHRAVKKQGYNAYQPPPPPPPQHGGGKQAAFSMMTSSVVLYASTASARVEQESAASKFSGGGPIMADMNKYNLPFDKVIEEWTASLVAGNAMQDAGVYLGARNAKEIFVDTLKIALPRRAGQGLGIELLELAGGTGRSDGLGITIASGLVPGGCAEFSGILPGDSISKVAVRTRRKTSTSQTTMTTMEEEEVVSVDTECLGYDATVDAILSLPAAPSQDNDDETTETVLTIKRLRRKPKISLTLQYPPSQNEPDVRLELFSGENLRRAMLARGVKLNDALARRFDSGGSGDCGAEGTCATCAVNVVRGAELLNPAGTTESQMVLAIHPRWRMACRAIVGYGMQEGELVVQVNPKQW